MQIIIDTGYFSNALLHLLKQSRKERSMLDFNLDKQESWSWNFRNWSDTICYLVIPRILQHLLENNHIIFIIHMMKHMMNTYEEYTTPYIKSLDSLSLIRKYICEPHILLCTKWRVFTPCSFIWSVTESPTLKAIVAVINMNLYVCGIFSGQQIKLFSPCQFISVSPVCIAQCNLKPQSWQCCYLLLYIEQIIFYDPHFHLLL